MKNQNSEKSQKNIHSTWSSAVEKNINKGEDVFKVSMDQAKKAHNDISASVEEISKQAIDNSTKSAEKIVNHLNQNINDSSAKSKCLDGTCSCCDLSSSEFMKDMTSNIEKNIEQITKLGYAFVKCRSTQDIINWQHELIKVNIDSLMRLSTLTMNNWSNIAKDLMPRTN